jgi:hypothetical protein
MPNIYKSLERQIASKNPGGQDCIKAELGTYNYSGATVYRNADPDDEEEGAQDQALLIATKSESNVNQMRPGKPPPIAIAK